jgi:hypothetical protein
MKLNNFKSQKYHTHMFYFERKTYSIYKILLSFSQDITFKSIKPSYCMLDFDM